MPFNAAFKISAVAGGKLDTGITPCILTRSALKTDRVFALAGLAPNSVVLAGIYVGEVERRSIFDPPRAGLAANLRAPGARRLLSFPMARNCAGARVYFPNWVMTRFSNFSPDPTMNNCPARLPATRSGSLQNDPDGAALQRAVDKVHTAHVMEHSSGTQSPAPEVHNQA